MDSVFDLNLDSGTLDMDSGSDHCQNLTGWFLGCLPLLHKMMSKFGVHIVAEIHCNLLVYALPCDGRESLIMIHNSQKTPDCRQNLINSNYPQNFVCINLQTFYV